MRVSSAAMILENDDGQALIVKASYKSYWTFPGGIIDPGETPMQGAIRETLEEVGVRLDPRRVEFVAVVDRRSAIAETYQFVFKAPLEHYMLDAIKLQATEIEAYALVTKPQVRERQHNYGTVIDYWAGDRHGYIEQLFEDDTRA